MKQPATPHAPNGRYLFKEPNGGILGEWLRKAKRRCARIFAWFISALTGRTCALPEIPATTKVRNDLFDAANGLDRGHSRWVEAAWYLFKCIFFVTPLPYPSRIKVCILRWFGASIGRGVAIKPRVNIHFPWKLSIGDYSWIGEEVFILNFEPVNIGSHCCISQRAFLCTGNHDYRQLDMRYRNRAIIIEDGAWVGAQVFVSPNVTIRTEAVITAGSVVTKSQPAKMVCGGNPCVALKHRWSEDESDDLGFHEYLAPRSGVR
jgi:putative colanic acid biosynthesis acetyltransferase WcaF